VNTRAHLRVALVAGASTIGAILFIGFEVGRESRPVHAADAPSISFADGCPSEQGEAAGVILLRSAIPVDGAYQIALRFDRRVADLLEFSRV